MKLERQFYAGSALDIAQDFLGKALVHNTAKGKLKAIITEVEAYPAFVDEVSHGNKRTKRTEVIYGPPGYAYIYFIYGMHHQLAAVVNGPGVPEVVFIRSAIPVEGIELMKKLYGRNPGSKAKLTKGPGVLCKSFGINRTFYGIDLTGNKLFLEDIGLGFSPRTIQCSPRIGIRKEIPGSHLEYRYCLSKPALEKLSGKV